MKKTTTIWVLFLVLMALGGIATWDEWQTQRDKENEKQKNRLTDMTSEEITSLEYTELKDSRGEKVATYESGTQQSPATIKANKSDNSWNISAPVMARGDIKTFDSLLKTLTDYTYAQEVAQDQSKWSQFGLDTPQRQITITSQVPGKKPLTIFLGSKAPVGYNVYLRTSQSDKVFIGSQHILMATEKSLFDFRDKKINSLNETLVKELTYHAKGQPEIKMVKSSDNYVIVAPSRVSADSAEIKDFIADISELNATQIIDQPSPSIQSALQDPDINVSWNDEGGIHHLSISAVDQNLYAKRDSLSTVYEIGIDQKSKLTKDLMSFRDRRIFTPDSLSLKSMTIDGATYARVNGAWIEQKDPTEKKNDLKGKDQVQDKSNLTALLVDLEFAKTDQFWDPKNPQIQKYLAAAPQHRLTMTPEGPGKEPWTIDVFSSDDDSQYLVKVSNLLQIYRLPKMAFKNLQPNVSSATAPESQPSTDLPDLPDTEEIPETID